jgi:hypothetical protein
MALLARHADRPTGYRTTATVGNKGADAEVSRERQRSIPQGDIRWRRKDAAERPAIMSGAGRIASAGFTRVER